MAARIGLPSPVSGIVVTSSSIPWLRRSIALVSRLVDAPDTVLHAPSSSPIEVATETASANVASTGTSSSHEKKTKSHVI
jgi:hypothetical protein